jgi:hypothetical protein
MADEVGGVEADAGELHRRAQSWAKQVAAYESERATLTERLAAAEAERQALAAKVVELEPVAKTAAELRAQYDALTLDVQRDRGLRSAGIAGDDPRGDSLVKHWRREQAELPEDKRAGFDAWLTSARESDPIVAALIKPAGTVASTSSGQGSEPVRQMQDQAAMLARHGAMVRAGDIKGARELMQQIRAGKA